MKIIVQKNDGTLMAKWEVTSQATSSGSAIPLNDLGGAITSAVREGERQEKPNLMEGLSRLRDSLGEGGGVVQRTIDLLSSTRGTLQGIVASDSKSWFSASKAAKTALERFDTF